MKLKKYVISAKTLEKVLDMLGLYHTTVTEEPGENGEIFAEEWNNEEVLEVSNSLESEIRAQEPTDGGE